MILCSFIESASVSPVYGGSLEDHLKRMNRDISVVLEECICTLLMYGMNEEGLFRIAGSASKVKKLKVRICQKAYSWWKCKFSLLWIWKMNIKWIVLNFTGSVRLRYGRHAWFRQWYTYSGWCHETLLARTSWPPHDLWFVSGMDASSKFVSLNSLLEYSVLDFHEYLRYISKFV